MPRTLLFVSLLLVPAGLAHAQTQSRFYAAVTTAADAGERGNIPGGTVPSIGAMLGVRFTDAWSLEVEVERGFRRTTAGSGEATILSFPPTTPNRPPTREEIELYGIRARSDRTQTAGSGFSVLAVYRTREPGRVNAGLLGGISSRVYDSGLVRTTTFVSPLLDLGPGYRLPDETSSRRMVGSGLTGGLVIFVRATQHLTFAPDLRVTGGLITNDHYLVLRSGLRVIWNF